LNLLSGLFFWCPDVPLLAFVLDTLLVLSGYSLLKTTERAPRHVGKSYSRRTQKVVNECTTYFVRSGERTRR
ncbi:TPA: hypothetical protein ACIAMN_002456, partial [Salmonella enterica subsp. enterica serovar Waycross]